MRKKFLLLITMFLGALYVGCSSDDGYLSYELDEDAKLQNTKNLILSYGQKYGLSNIQFNDELLRKNLDLPKEEYEKDIICMAISVGKLKPSSKILRKTRRSSGFGDNDPNPGGKPNNEPTLFVEDNVDISYNYNPFVFKFQINYRFCNRGYGTVGVVNEQASVYKLKKCDIPRCGDIHPLHEVDIHEYAGCYSIESHPAFLGCFTWVVGSKLNFTAHYTVQINYPKASISCQTSETFNSTGVVKSE